MLTWVLFAIAAVAVGALVWWLPQPAAQEPDGTRRTDDLHERTRFSHGDTSLF